jgi:Tetratricopeptide repeat
VSNLAGVLGYQGKYDEAESMHRRALAGRGDDRREYLVDDEVEQYAERGTAVNKSTPG